MVSNYGVNKKIYDHLLTKTIRVEKYRPKTLSDVCGQNDIIKIIKKFVEKFNLPHMLFYGPPGSGKTSTILALANEIYGKNYKNMVLELNASDDRGIDIVRNQIKDFASTMQIFSKGFKLIILDEIDSMTQSAQNSLRRIIEKYTKNTRFCLLANYSYKVNPALISRCTCFRFNLLPEIEIKEIIKKIIINEHIKVTDQAENAFLKFSKGDLRKTLNLMQSCKSACKMENNITLEEINEDMVYRCVGYPNNNEVESILDIILKENWNDSFFALNNIIKVKGFALLDLINGFIEILNKYQMKTKSKIELYKGLADLEYAISKNGDSKIYLTTAIGVIKGAMDFEEDNF